MVTMMFHYKNQYFVKTSRSGEDLVDDLLRILGPPQSETYKIWISFLNGRGGRKFLEKLHFELEKKDPKFKIKTFHFLYDTQEDDVHYLPGILKRMDTKNLRRFEVKGKLPKDIFTEILETEQWKSIQRLAFGVDQRYSFVLEVPIENLLDVEQVKIEVEDVSNEDVVKVIENFRTEPREVCSFFSISKKEQFDKGAILQSLNEPIGNSMSFVVKDTYFQKFKMTRDHTILVVKFSQCGHTIDGVVCEKEEIFTTFLPGFPEDLVMDIILLEPTITGNPWMG